MLHDLMPDIVTVSFGARTREIHKRLRSRGCRSVGSETGRASGCSAFHSAATAVRPDRGRSACALIAVTGEMHIAETRAW